MLVFRRIQSLAHGQICRFRIKERLELKCVVEGAAAQRNHQVASSDFLKTPPRSTVIAATVYPTARKLERDKLL